MENVERRVWLTFSILHSSFYIRTLVSRVGIEPTTNWLKANCSTTELPALKLLLIKPERPTKYGVRPDLSTSAASTSETQRILRVLPSQSLLLRLRARQDKRNACNGINELGGKAASLAEGLTIELMSEDVLSMPEKVGRYRLLSRLGAGGMGEVFLAEDPLLGRKVAIKLLLVGTTNQGEAEQRMLREARAAARLDHHNACTIFEAGSENGRVYLVMQYLDGTTVSDSLRKGPLPINEILIIARGVAEALREAHRIGLVHRDIKPQNVMITSKGIKVLDFGLARLHESADENITATGVVSGTTPYMAPEQLRLEPANERSDVFSFGVMLYELTAGRRPFDSGSVVETISAILKTPPPPMPSRGKRGRALEDLIIRMLEKKTESRPGMDEVAEGLERIAALQSDEDSTPTAFVSISDIFRASHSVSSPANSSSTTTIADPEQQKLYAKGRHLLSKRTGPHIKQALGIFQQIVDLDPECAPAYSGLADSYLLLGFLQMLAPKATFPKALAAAGKAVQIERDRADAHATLGYVHLIFDWDLQASERELRTSISIDPNFATGHHWLGIALLAGGRREDAQASLSHARELDPLSSIFAVAAAFPDVYQRRYEKALRIYDEISELDPTFVAVHYYRGLALEQVGDLDSALEAFQQASRLAPVRVEAYASSIHCRALRGDELEARKMLDILREDAASRYVPPLLFAIAHLGLSEFDQALGYIEEAIEQRGVRLSDLHLDHRFDRIPDRAAFDKLIERIGVRPR